MENITGQFHCLICGTITQSKNAAMAWHAHYISHHYVEEHTTTQP